MDWNEVSAISTAVQAIIVIAAAALALWQLQEALTARRMAGFLRLMDELESGTVQQTRRFFNTYQEDVRQIADTGNLQELDKFIRRKTRRWQQPLSLGSVRDDLTKLEYTAMLCLHGMLPIKLERTYFTTVVVLTWPYIEPVALMLRQARGVQYMQHFEALYRLYSSGAIYRGGYARSRKREASRLMLVSMSVVVAGDDPRANNLTNT
jgi:hypothetical protein